MFLQKSDAMCLLPLNIVNEKIFLVLWAMFIILVMITITPIIVIIVIILIIITILIITHHQVLWAWFIILVTCSALALVYR